MMIAVEVPQKSMHYKTVCKPGDAFHGKKGGEDNEYEKSPIHDKNYGNNVLNNKKNISWINNKFTANLFCLSNLQA